MKKELALLAIAVAFGIGVGISIPRAGAAPSAHPTKHRAVFHVNVAACNNTIRKRELSPSDLTPGVKVVDSGVAEVIRKQEEGWSYVKLAY